MNVISPEDVDTYLRDHAPGTIYGVKVTDGRAAKFLSYALRTILLDRQENLEEVTELPENAPQWLKKKWPEGGPYYHFAPNQALDEQVDHIGEWIAGAITDREAWIDQCDAKGQPYKLAQMKTLGDTMKAANEAMHLRNERLAKQYANVFANEEIVAKFDEKGCIHLPGEKGYAELEAPHTMVRLRTGDELNLESTQMGHCIGREGYHARLETGQCKYFSLRDKKNKPHATFEVTADHKLLQCRGAQNQPPVAKYRPMVQAFVHQQQMRFRDLDFDVGLICSPNGLYFDVYNLPTNFTYNDNLDFTYTFEDKLKSLQITQLPEGLHIRGNLVLKNTPLKKLPKNLTVDGHLDLNGSQITELPENLNVGRSIDIRGTAIKSIPDDAKVGGTVLGFTYPIPPRPVAPQQPLPIPQIPTLEQAAQARERQTRQEERHMGRIEVLRARLEGALPGGWVEKVVREGLVNEAAAMAGAGAGRMR